MTEPTRIERRSLEAHVELCAKRYSYLESKMESLDEKITKVDPPNEEEVEVRAKAPEPEVVAIEVEVRPSRRLELLKKYLEAMQIKEMSALDELDTDSD